MTERSSDPYKVLQVDPEAEDEVIAAAYRRLARKYHPDTAAGDPAAAAAASARPETLFTELVLSWAIYAIPR